MRSLFLSMMNVSYGNLKSFKLISSLKRMFQLFLFVVLEFLWDKQYAQN